MLENYLVAIGFFKDNKLYGYDHALFGDCPFEYGDYPYSYAYDTDFCNEFYNNQSRKGMLEQGINEIVIYAIINKKGIQLEDGQNFDGRNKFSYKLERLETWIFNPHKLNLGILEFIESLKK
jgi:hypothetical protein